MNRYSRGNHERFPLEHSAWAQSLTQSGLAELLGTSKGRLKTIIGNKDRWILRRHEEIGGKLRNLAIPIGRLRAVHEILKRHFNRIQQPEYLFSPKKGRSQRDNAAFHAGQKHFLKLDIRQFYPMTTSEDVFRWAHHTMGLRADVAGIFLHLVTVDRRIPFGSPVSPVLTSLVHRPMFDAVHAACLAEGLRMSVWVDDLTISGSHITGQLLDKVRTIIRNGGFQTHKVEFRTNAPGLLVTGIPILGDRVGAPRGVHNRVQEGYAALRPVSDDAQQMHGIDKLLSALGTYRYHVGSGTPEGRKAADRMHALKQRRARLVPSTRTVPSGAALIAFQESEKRAEVAPPWAS